MLSNKRDLFNRDLLIKYLLLFFGCAAGITVAVKLTVPEFFTTDTWWHIAVGKWMWLNHAIATYDPFSWSLPGAPWIAQEWLVAGLSFVASLITPWGFKLYHYAFASVTEKSFQQYIQEWMAPPFEMPFIKSITLLAVILVIGGFLVSRKPVRLNTLLVCGGLFFQALSQFRYFPLLGIAVAPLLGEMFRADEHSCNDGKLAAVGVVAGLLIGSLVGGMPSSLENAARGAGYPVDAVEHIKPGEKVLNTYNWGGYLIYRDVPVFIDSRADFYLWEGEVYKDYMESTTKLGFEELLIKYRPDAVLIGVDTVLKKFMELLPGWEKTYQDGTAVIYRPSG